MIDIRTTKEGIAFWVVVQPRSSKAAIVGVHQNDLKVKLTAPPVGGAANKQCIALIAKALARPKSTIDITSGQTNRRKQILIRSKSGAMDKAEAETIKQKLSQLI